MELSPKVYDVGQWFVRIFLPAWITFYGGLGTFVGVPAVAEVVGISGLVGVFLGALLASSSAQFKRDNEKDGGVLQIKGFDENGMPHLGLDVQTDPVELAGKKTVTLKVDTPPVANPAAPEVEAAPVDNRPPWQQVPEH